MLIPAYIQKSMKHDGRIINNVKDWNLYVKFFLSSIGMHLHTGTWFQYRIYNEWAEIMLFNLSWISQYSVKFVHSSPYQSL